MIDWWSLATGALWISGLALLLAAWSYRRFMLARTLTDTRRGRMVRRTQVISRLALLLVIGGLGSSSAHWGVAIGWALLFLIVLLDLVIRWSGK